MPALKLYTELCPWPTICARAACLSSNSLNVRCGALAYWGRRAAAAAMNDARSERSTHLSHPVQAEAARTAKPPHTHAFSLPAVRSRT